MQMVKIRLKAEILNRRFTDLQGDCDSKEELLGLQPYEYPMLEFAPNTIAIMTASLDQCCKKMKSEAPEARRFIAERLKEAARCGQVSLSAQTEVGEAAVAKLNRGDEAGGWRALLQWVI